MVLAGVLFSTGARFEFTALAVTPGAGVFEPWLALAELAFVARFVRVAGTPG